MYPLSLTERLLYLNTSTRTLNYEYVNSNSIDVFNLEWPGCFIRDRDV